MAASPTTTAQETPDDVQRRPECTAESAGRSSFDRLHAYVTGPETRTATAYTVELTLFRRLLALGAALLRVFFQTRAAERPAGPVHVPDETPLGYHDRRFTTASGPVVANSVAATVCRLEMGAPVNTTCASMIGAKIGRAPTK